MLAIAGGKGGCGKTTTTLGLARALARTGHRVLAVDADRDMPNLHAMAGIEGDSTLAALAAGTPVESVARPIPECPRAAILPAAPGVERREVRRALGRASTSDATVLVDCPAGAGPAAIDPVRAADRALVVTTPAPAGVRDAAKTAAVARAVGTPVAGCVVTRTDAVPGGLERLVDAPTIPILETGETPATTPTRSGYEKIVNRLW